MQSGITYSWVLASLLNTLELVGAFSAPVGDITKIIQTPCGIPINITERNKRTSKYTISQLHTLVNVAKSRARTAKSKMTNAIGSSEMVERLDNVTFFKTINAKEIVAGLDIQQGLGKLFKSNFGHFSKLAIYNNFAASYGATSHVNNIKAVLDKLWTILCELQIGTLSQGESMTQYLNSSIISDQEPLGNTFSEAILYRNYIIMRDVETNLEQFSLLYTYIKDRL